MRTITWMYDSIESAKAVASCRAEWIELSNFLMLFLESVQNLYWIFSPALPAFPLSLSFQPTLTVLVSLPLFASSSAVCPHGACWLEYETCMAGQVQDSVAVSWTGGVRGACQITVVLLCPARALSDALSITC